MMAFISQITPMPFLRSLVSPPPPLCNHFLHENLKHNSKLPHGYKNQSNVNNFIIEMSYMVTVRTHVMIIHEFNHH